MNRRISLIALGLCLLPGGHGAVRAAVDSAGQQAAGIVAGVHEEASPALVLNEKTGRLEFRNMGGALLEEIVPGTTGKVLDLGGQEYRVSFGKDTEGRPSVLVRPGPAMRKPVFIRVLGRKAVLSSEASLVATLGDDELVYFEPSISGQVYYIEPDLNLGGEVSRRAIAMRESAILAKPPPLASNQLGEPDPASEYKKDMDSAGEAVKGALLTLFGLPDKQPTQKARVYKLQGGPDIAPDPNASGTPSRLGRP